MKTINTRPATETKEIFIGKLKQFSNYEVYLKRINDAKMTFEVEIDEERNEVYISINGIAWINLIFDDNDSLDAYAYATIRTMSLTYSIAKEILNK